MFNLKLSKTMKDVQWSFISLVTASFSHLLLRIVLGKELGPSGLGLYTLVFTIYMFGMQFAVFGIGAALTKYIAQYHDDLPKIKEYVTSGVLGSMISGTVFGILLYLLSGIISIKFFHNPEMTDLLKMTAFCFPFIAMQKVVIGTLNGMRKMKLYAFVNIVQNVSVMIVSITLVMMLDMGVRGAVIGYVVPTIVVGLASLYLEKNYIEGKYISATKYLKKLYYFGLYIMLGNSVSLINTNIDSVLIGYFMDEFDVGIYSVAIIFMSGITLLPHAIQRVTAPSVTTHYSKKEYGTAYILIKQAMVKTFIITFALSAVIAYFGKFLIVMLFTKDFLSAYAPLLILLIGYTIYAPFVSVGSTFASIGKVKVSFAIISICVVTNVFLNILLIPAYGLLGAAVATSISLILTFCISVYYISKYITKNN